MQDYSDRLMFAACKIGHELARQRIEPRRFSSSGVAKRRRRSKVAKASRKRNRG